MATRRPAGKLVKSRKAAQVTQFAAGSPEVIVDFIFEAGLFYVAVENISNQPAFKVKVQFDPCFRGLAGTQEVSTLPLFQNIEFLAPRKRIVTFLDSSTAYFGRGEPTRIGVKIGFTGAKGERYRSSLQHDLEIYKTISYVQRDAAASGARRTDQTEA
jgi:hypothetical protein